MTHVANTLEQTQTLSLVPAPIELSIAQLDAHTLLDQDRAALMTRVDDKFVIHKHNLESLLHSMVSDYSVLEDRDIRKFDYKTIYYDTGDYELYHQHHSGKANRLKVRTREYVQSKICFLEIKEKNNKGITHKYRHNIGNTNHHLHVNKIWEQKDKNKPLIACLEVNYQRITLLHKTLNQRVTIDINLSFHDLINNGNKLLDDIAIIEVKRDKADHALKNSKLHKLLKEFGYFPKTFSKYCMGCVLTKVPNIKTNRFKFNYLSLKKLLSN
ncbi:polyphosphate polymerase domain-containing protein [Oceaniserpentilla sp. 4NH20-0058]|uniref:polyphosphate polymerase domain-containing protein n=1 Tax=Oceaniserpentilla sp. 4NH20-0058 TaxID=3127660 RepID=UPI0031090C24